MPKTSDEKERLQLPFFLWILPLVFCSSQVYADFFIHSWENHFERKSHSKFQLDSYYFNTTSNYDPFGNVYTPTGFQNLARFEGDLTFTYGLAERLSLFGRLTWAYIYQNSTVRQGSGFGFADQSVGLTYRIFGSPSQVRSAEFKPVIDIQIQTDFPAYNNSTSDANNTPDLGDDTIDATAGAFVTVPFLEIANHLFETVIGAGYTYRTSNFSMAIPWSVLVQSTPKKTGFLASLGALGLSSLKTDPNAGSTTSSRSSAGSGGSFMTGDINPSLIRLYSQVGYQFKHSKLTLSGAQSIWGQDSPNGFTFELSFQFQFGKDKTSTIPALLTPQDYGLSNQGFLNYSLEARIIKSRDRLNLVKIDKGSEDGVEVGQVFDVFSTKKDKSGGQAIARGKILSVKTHEAALSIQEYYKEVWIDEGFSAKRLITELKEIE